MYEIGVTSLNHEKTILGTFGAGPCIILAIFNPNDHTALLSHLSSGVSSKHFFPYLNQFSKDQGKKFQAYIAGSDHSTRNQMSTLIDDLQKRDDLEIVGVSLGDGFNDKSLAIDALTGEVFTDFNPDQLQDRFMSQAKIMVRSSMFLFNPSSARLDEIKIPLKQYAGKSLL
jgi:hypothetical protein